MSQLFRLGKRLGRRVFQGIRQIGSQINDISHKIHRAGRFVSGIPGANALVDELVENIPFHNEIKLLFKAVESIGPKLSALNTPTVLKANIRRPREAHKAPLSSSSIGNIAPVSGGVVFETPTPRAFSSPSPSRFAGGSIPSGGISLG